MEEKTELQKKAVRLVAEQIINMLTNNILEDNGTEGFAGWCENGAVFFEMEGLSDEEKDAASTLMTEVAPTVDELTYNWLNLGY